MAGRPLRRARLAAQADGKGDVIQRVTDRIIEQIEAGAADGKWKMPWTKGAHGGFPINAISGWRYRGINVPILLSAGYATPLWATQKQWAGAGAEVRDDERPETIVFWKKWTPERDDDEDDGETKPASRARLYARAHLVFNVAQVSGWTAPAVERPSLAERLQHAEDYVGNTGIRVRHGQGRAFYSPDMDFVGMPDRDQFKPGDEGTATEAYYSTLLHELVHATAHPARLDREFGKAKRFGDDAYAVEELVAELGSAFLCASLSITPEPRLDHAKYVASWLRVLRADKYAISTAASAATKAMDWLDAQQHDEEELPVAA